MATPLPTAPHALLGSRRMIVALAIIVAAVAAAVITTVLLLQSGTTNAPSVVDDPRPAVSDSGVGGMQDHRWHSADTLARRMG